MVRLVSSASRSFEHRFRLIGANRHNGLSVQTKYMRATLVVVACLLLCTGFHVATSGNFVITTNLRIEMASSGAKTQLSAAHITRDATVGPPVAFRRCVNDDHIALTFDDGPNELTLALLDLFATYDVKATFFFVGVNLELDETNRLAAKRAVDEGHHVASHLWSHPDLTKLDHERIREQLANNSDALLKVTRRRPRYMRPPYGSANNAVERTIFAEGYKSMMWSCDSSDWRLTNEADVTANIDRCALDGLVLLLHEGRQSTVDAVDKFVRRVRREHPLKQFVRGDECSGYPGDAYVVPESLSSLQV